MLKAIGVFLICGAAFPALSQSSAQSNKGPSSTDVQQQQRPIKSVEIIGLDGVKDKTGGRLTIGDGKLYFSHSGTKSEIPVTSMEDVVTAGDSQRIIRGALGTMSMFAPYESGRVLAMFRSKIDSLTIKYRDDNGGLHGAIFTMPKGTAEPLKRALIKEGAHTTIPAPASTSADPSHQTAARGKQ